MSAEIETQLKEYRALRRRKELVQKTKDKLEGTKQKIKDLLTFKLFNKMTKEKDDEVILLESEEELANERPISSIEPDNISITSETSITDPPSPTAESRRYQVTKFLIYCTIWITLFIFFLKIQFGAVYFVLSLLIIIYLNTGTKPKKPGEVSAYSVFNENCVSIDGTLKAEQFEREIRYGAGSVR